MQEDVASVCPLCCEQLDDTEKKHHPCPCGCESRPVVQTWSRAPNSRRTAVNIVCRYQVCLFCLQRLQDEYGNRCPACRTVYGTDREEWERQAEARAQEARAKAEQRPKQSPKPLSSPSPRNAEVSSSHAVFPALDEEPRGPTLSAAENFAQPSNQPGPSYIQPADEHADEHDWPLLSHFQGPRPSHAVSSAAGGTAQMVSDSGNAHSSLNASACEGSAPRRPPGLPLPVTVQSVVNGTSTSLDTVIDLGASPDNLHTYVAKDLNPLIQQLKSLQTSEKTSKKGATAAPTQKHPAAALSTFSAAKRASVPVSGAACTVPQAPPGLPPGLERRVTNPNTHTPTAAGLWPQPSNDVSAREDALSTAFRSPSTASTFSTQGQDGLAGTITSSASTPPNPTPPPGLAPPPGLSGMPSVPSTIAHAPVEPTAGVLPAAAPAPTSNILHELFPREKSGRLGWFAAPAPAFEGHMHQLWDSSAPLSTLVHPTLSSTRNRRPLYARNPDNVPPTINEEDGCGPPPGLERDSARDPVVATLTRKLGGRAAEIGANVQ